MKKTLLIPLLMAFEILVAQPPIITSFFPASGPAGTTVTITGTGFSANPSENIVYFGVVKAPIVSASSTSLTVTAPAGATYQPITVTTNGLSGYSSKPFLISFKPQKAGLVSNKLVLQNTIQAKIWNAFENGDFNGDGKPDLAVIDAQTNTLTILRNNSNNGNYDFLNAGEYEILKNPVLIAVSDIDGDSKPDIALTSLGGVSVFRNTSSAGTITFAQRIDVNTGAIAFGVAIGDLDFDGKPDVAVSNYSSNTISILRNIGTAGQINFASKVDFVTGASPGELVIGDINGDDRQDLTVVNTSSGSFSIFQNRSSPGTIDLSNKIDIPTGSNPRSIAIADLDIDGRLDVALATWGPSGNQNTITAFRNTSVNGVISFAPKKTFTGRFSAQDISIADLDGDGKPHLVVGSNSIPEFSVYRNLSAVGDIVLSPQRFSISNPTSVLTGDWDIDGLPNVMVESLNNNISIYEIETLCAAESFFVDITVKDASCNSNNGEILIAVPGNTSDSIFYSIDGGQTYTLGPSKGFSFAQLPAGNYTTNVKDANGCLTSMNQTIVRASDGIPRFLDNLQIVKDASCGVNDGNITIVPTCGRDPFYYSIDGGQTYIYDGNPRGHTFINLAPGSYDLRLKDGLGSESAVVTKEVRSVYGGPAFLNSGAIVLDASCRGNDGNISIIPTCGMPPFQYSINGGATYVMGPDAGYTFQNLSSGTYQLRLKDATGKESAVVTKEVKANAFGPCITVAPASRKATAILDRHRASLNAYPNPSKGRFGVQLQNMKGKLQVVVLDSKGVVVEQRMVNTNEGNILSLDLTGKAKGLYFVRMATDKGVQITRVLIQ